MKRSISLRYIFGIFEYIVIVEELDGVISKRVIKIGLEMDFNLFEYVRDEMRGSVRKKIRKNIKNE